MKKPTASISVFLDKRNIYYLFKINNIKVCNKNTGSSDIIYSIRFHRFIFIL